MLRRAKGGHGCACYRHDSGDNHPLHIWQAEVLRVYLPQELAHSVLQHVKSSEAQGKLKNYVSSWGKGGSKPVLGRKC